MIPQPALQPEGSARPYLTALAVALICGVAIYFRLYDLGGRDLWTDEAWVALAAMQPTAREALAAGQSTPPFYLLTVWAAVQLWGHSEAVLRGLSLVFGVGTLFLIWRLGRTLVEIPAALLALAAVAFSPVMVYYSKELKQYSGDAFFAVLALWLAERLLARQGRRGWLFLSLAGMLGLGFSHAMIFTLPVVGAVLWLNLPRDRRPRLILLGGLWVLTFAVYFFLFIRREVDPELVDYWTQDFPDFAGLIPFLRWLGGSFHRYFWYFLGEWGVFWGPPLLAAGLVLMVRRGRTRALLYLGGPLLLAFGAACVHRYPFMAHFGGNRLMLFSAPVLYLAVAAGAWGLFAWLLSRRQRATALALTGIIVIALHPLANLRENLYPLNNREEIQPLVAYLEKNRQPQDLVYVYYFAVSPFKYYYHGPPPGICWGQSCVEKGLSLKEGAGAPPPRLWLVASHIPDLKFLRQFAADLLGPDWREAACLTRVGAVLLRFDRLPEAVAAKPPAAPPVPPESGVPAPSGGMVYESGPKPPAP
ncbi:MAG: glycosyltransferase family 39 protein [Syntrophobacterales bacterium]|nr:glycosyltransferase family 39 protein [Syntrophobacterales bacterium]